MHVLQVALNKTTYTKNFQQDFAELASRSKKHQESQQKVEEMMAAQKIVVVTLMKEVWENQRK